ncbi:MAG: hypothetical protein IH592_07720, partial [Bacteroidales bacterium]|nr:hypothetical protein [Bacteroidales bacterium]
MKNFDDIFRRKVKEAFDNYNADHLAEEGWNSYVRKHGGKRIRAIVIPFWARAASIAVLVTVGVLFTERINHRKAGEPVNQIAEETRSELTESAKKEDTAAASPVIADSGAVFEAAAGKTPVRANPDQASGTTVSKAGQIRQTGTENPGYQVSQPAGPVLADGSLLSDTSMAAGSILSETKLAAAMSDGMKLPDNPMKIRLTYAADTQLKLTSNEEPKDFPVLPREKMTTTIMGGLSGMMASIDNTTSISQGVSIGF